MTAWLDDAEMRAWRGLVEVSTAVSAELNAELDDEFGLGERDYAVLVQLSEAPGRRLRMSDLAERLHLSPSGLTRRLDGLAVKGLVTREASADDRRVSFAVLTDEGLRRLEEAAPVHVAGVRRVFLDRLTPDQIATLGDIWASVLSRAGGAQVGTGQQPSGAG